MIATIIIISLIVILLFITLIFAFGYILTINNQPNVEQLIEDEIKSKKC